MKTALQMSWDQFRDQQNLSPDSIQLREWDEAHYLRRKRGLTDGKNTSFFNPRRFSCPYLTFNLAETILHEWTHIVWIGATNRGTYSTEYYDWEVCNWLAYYCQYSNPYYIWNADRYVPRKENDPDKTRCILISLDSYSEPGLE